MNAFGTVGRPVPVRGLLAVFKAYNSPWIRAGCILGLGLGAFFDGILFHQILGWHHMICRTETCQPATVAELQRQNTEDGFFLLGALLLTIFGVILLFRATRQPVPLELGNVFSGAVLVGWGSFIFLEGLINHQLLGLHHVLPGNHQFLFDMLYLGCGLLFATLGWIMVRGPVSRTSA